MAVVPAATMATAANRKAAAPNTTPSHTNTTALIGCMTTTKAKMERTLETTAASLLNQRGSGPASAAMTAANTRPTPIPSTSSRSATATAVACSPAPR